jgi:hypothetical protein
MGQLMQPAAAFMLPANLPIRKGKARGMGGFSYGVALKRLFSVIANFTMIVQV